MVVNLFEAHGDVEPVAPSFEAVVRLVIVQRNAFAGRALARYLAPHFTSTCLVAGPHQVEDVLATCKLPTALVCGQRFAPGVEAGTRWVAGWRARAPWLVRVVIATAEPVSQALGVDVVFGKPLNPAAILAYLSPSSPAPDVARALP